MTPLRTLVELARAARVALDDPDIPPTLRWMLRDLLRAIDAHTERR